MKSRFVCIKYELLTGRTSSGFVDGKWRLLFSLQKISEYLHSRMHLLSYNVDRVKIDVTTQSKENQENFDPSQGEKGSLITYKTIIFLKLYLECPKGENRSPRSNQLAG